MKVLLTGATGFIGRHLLPVITAGGHEVFAVTRQSIAMTSDLRIYQNLTWHQCDLANAAAVSALVADIVPDACIHLAWDTEPGKYLDDIGSNLKLLEQSLHLLRTLARHSCHQFIALGSCAEYALNNEIHPGTKLSEMASTRPETIYAAAKLSLCLLGQQVVKNTKTKFCWGRLFYLYGPGEHDKRLVPGVISALATDHEFKASSGEQFRDYLYVKDVASAIACLLDKKAGGIFNICSGEETQVKTILLACGKHLNKTHLIRLGALPARPWDPDYIVGDNSKLKLLGWSPRYDLNVGLIEMIHTMQSQH